VLLPILENQYGRVLESGKLRLEYADGSFQLCYYDRRLPVNPRSYGRVLSYKLDELTQALGPDDEYVAELQSILTAIN
jgi:(1->4)-alpha-D-glucan 1-alpha-D-glucosylmutase